jgi:amino acid transporter
MSTKPFDQDPEKDGNYGGSSPKNGDDQPVSDHVDEEQKGPILTRFVSSFKRDPTTISTYTLRAEDGGFDHEGAAQRTANSGLVRKLKGRHLQMIAIGGSIGEFNANQLERGVANNP